MLTILNPFDLAAVDTMEEDSPEAVTKALAQAREWHRDRRRWLSAEQRIAVLEAAADLAEARKAALESITVRESGMLLRDARSSLAHVINLMRHHAALLRSNRQEESMRWPELSRLGVLAGQDPAGLILATSTSIDPLNPAVRQIIPAVAVGCPIIARLNPAAPLTSRALTAILREAGLPAGWAWCWVTVADPPAGTIPGLSEVDMYSHVGPVPANGVKLQSSVAAIHRFDDSERSNAIVAGDVDVYEVRDSLLPGCFLHAGQAHGSVQRVFAHARVASRLATQMAMRASGLRVGDPLDDKVEMGPLINPERADHLNDLIHEAVAGGAQLLTGGERLTGSLYAPTVLFNPPPECRLMTANAPGPVTCVTPWFEVDDMLQRVNTFTTGTRVAVYGRDMGATLEIARSVTAATVTVNEPPTAVQDPPVPGHFQRSRRLVIRTQPLQLRIDPEPA